MNPSKKFRTVLANFPRALFPNRPVRRTVQGVELILPWSHRLPDYATDYPLYGQNLVALARIISDAARSPICVLDIGANVGDSALQILKDVDVEIVCIDADPYWIDFLRKNTEQHPLVRIVHCLLLPSGQQGHEDYSAQRTKGTTRFVPGAPNDPLPSMTAETLRDSLPNVAPVRLIKSDTDGFDVQLVPSLARAYSETHPTLFFEFDPPLSRAVGDQAPESIWAALTGLGYERCIVWDNFGNLLAHKPIAEMAEWSRATFEKNVKERGYHYWDVAAIHCDDDLGCSIMQELCV